MAENGNNAEAAQPQIATAPQIEPGDKFVIVLVKRAAPLGALDLNYSPEMKPAAVIALLSAAVMALAELIGKEPASRIHIPSFLRPRP